MGHDRPNPASASGNGPSTRTDRFVRHALIVGVTISALLSVVAGIGWAHPESGPFGPGAYLVPLVDMAGPKAAAGIQFGTGIIGALAGLVKLLRPVRTAVLVAVGTVQVVVFGVGLQSPMVLNTTGYLVAMAMPVIGVVVLVQLFRRYRSARWWLGCPVLIIVVAAGFLGREPIARLAGLLGGAAPAVVLPMLMSLGQVLAGVCWFLVSAGTVARTDAGGRLLTRIVRHRRLFTLVAAGCLLPYGLARLSWLTPWPVFGGAGIDDTTRIWGLALGSAAWLGVVLTIGLVRPWGEVFPRWMPFLAGRPVPVMVAAGPAGAVAAVVCSAAVPWLVAAGRNVPVTAALDGSGGFGAGIGWANAVEAAVLFPCWLWGPSLALAVIGYIGHRRATPPAGRPSGTAVPRSGTEHRTPAPYGGRLRLRR